jgi:hypothetical protein
LAVDERRFARDPGDQGIKLDLSFDYSQFGQYYSAKGELPSAIQYQRKTLAIRGGLAASDPEECVEAGAPGVDLDEHCLPSDKDP